VRRLVVALDGFKDLNKGLLNALAENIETYVFSPEDIIAATDSKVNGIHIIGKGEIEICTPMGESIEILFTGQAFGYEALKKSFISLESYRSKTFCEILFLRGSRYRHILEIYHQTDKSSVFTSTSSMNNTSSPSLPISYRGSLVTPKRDTIAIGGGRFKRNRKNMKKWTSFTTFNKLHEDHFYQNWSIDNLLKAFEKSFQPKSLFREFWDCLIFFGLLFYLTSLPLLLAATFHDHLITNFWVLLIFSYIMDIFFFIDVILRATTFGIIHEGVLVHDRQELWSLFLKENSFLYHFLWIMPFDLIIAFSSGNPKLLPLFRLLKLLHMYRFLPFADLFMDFISRILQISISFEFSRFAILYLLLFQLCHWAGCIWQLTADISTDYYHYHTNWILQDTADLSHHSSGGDHSYNNHTDHSHSNHSSHGNHTYYNHSSSYNDTYYNSSDSHSIHHLLLSLLSAGSSSNTDVSASVPIKHDLVSVDKDSYYAVIYARSIYFAASAMSSVGFPDILPTNPVEMVVILFIIFFGYLAFNALLGAIAELIGNFNREKREFNSKVDKMRDLMTFTLIPISIESKTIRYFEYLWTRYEGVDENQVLRSLPKSLRSEVVYHVLGPLFNKIPFFSGCSEPLEHFILEMFESRVFLHGDSLMIAGEIGREMFIIEKGNVIVTSPDKTIIYTKLTTGDYAGESCLLESRPRTASVFAIGYVDTYFLSTECFEKVMSLHFFIFFSFTFSVLSCVLVSLVCSSFF
jgi:hypothetical protein